MTQDERDAYRAARALAVAWVLRRLGWVSFAIGIASLIGVLLLPALGQLDVEQALLAAVWSHDLWCSDLRSSMNVTLTASLVERSYPRVDGEA